MINCKTVWVGYEFGQDLGYAYYLRNILIQEKMLAQAAVRMAAIIQAVSYSK
jgi:hypothetical protein